MVLRPYAHRVFVIAGDLRRKAASNKGYTRQNLHTPTLKTILLYLCEVPGAVDEPGLIALLHVIKQVDVAQWVRWLRNCRNVELPSVKPGGWLSACIQYCADRRLYRYRS
jgi:hypothetical protein